jgi:two-component system sensor histidine kinase/response regulator
LTEPPPSSKPGRQGSGRPGPLTKARIWIIDDSALQAAACRADLEDAYDVSVYEAGALMLEALALLEPPDLLVVDWHMPDMSGAEVCCFVRERFNAAELPILILTANSTNESLLEALAAGANDFVRKPFLASELNARVAALLRSAALHAKLVTAEQQLRIEADFRERFMGMLAHDLRQPLNAIFMATSLLTNQLRGSQSSSVVAIQARAAERMKRMIAELLDFTRIRPETGMPIQRHPTDLVSVVGSIIEEFRAAHPARDFHFESPASCRGKWDPDRLAQVCSNLIGNAIEHSDPDSPVGVLLRCHDDSTAELVITNFGRPLSEAKLSQLFLPFRRGSTRPDGVGLGLYIVHEIVAAHGGTVTAKSEDGLTQFSVRLPYS